MISSMTSYHSVSKETDYGCLVIEIKTLNSRFFDLQIKLSDEFRIHETIIRKKISKVISRGKIECKAYFKTKEKLPEFKKNDLKVMKEVIITIEKISSLIKDPQKINPVDIVHLHNEKGDKFNYIGLSKTFLILFESSLKKIITDRQREGKKIKQLILSRNIKIEKEVKKIRKVIPKYIDNHQKKILKKFKEALINVDQDKIKQELLIFIQKGDIEEELDRLDSHSHELKRLLNLNEPVGKKIDFLMQEFNREVNTLGSKAIAVEISKSAVELKVLIEQIREQIQNIE
ncbi:MAG: YicC family protein [Nitrosomonadales bacterium]|nr:YicC family protein [Nitrosomonadales bacterium]